MIQSLRHRARSQINGLYIGFHRKEIQKKKIYIQFQRFITVKRSTKSLKQYCFIALYDQTKDNVRSASYRSHDSIGTCIYVLKHCSSNNT